MENLDPLDRPQPPQLDPLNPFWVTYWVTEQGHIEWCEAFDEFNDIEALRLLTRDALRAWNNRPVKILYSGPAIGYNEDYEGFAELYVDETSSPTGVHAVIIYANPLNYPIQGNI